MLINFFFSKLFKKAPQIITSYLKKQKNWLKQSVLLEDFFRMKTKVTKNSMILDFRKILIQWPIYVVFHSKSSSSIIININNP